jgi:hypothetical protein
LATVPISREGIDVGVGVGVGVCCAVGGSSGRQPIIATINEAKNTFRMIASVDFSEPSKRC